MRKSALLLALAFAISAPTVALAAKKKPAAKPDPAVAAQQDSAAFMRDALGQLVVPFQSLAKPAQPEKKAKKAAKPKAKKKKAA